MPDQALKPVGILAKVEGWSGICLTMSIFVGILHLTDFSSSLILFSTNELMVQQSAQPNGNVQSSPCNHKNILTHFDSPRLHQSPPHVMTKASLDLGSGRLFLFRNVYSETSAHLPQQSTTHFPGVTLGCFAVISSIFSP